MLRALFAVLAVLLAASAAAAGANLYDAQQPLVDDRGWRTTLGAWRGKPAIVSMEYANCRFVCSQTLARLKDIQAAADAAGRRFDFIVVSLDPKNDTPEAWVRYRKARGVERGNWAFLTATVADTPALARLFGVKYWLFDGHIMHDFRVLRVDAEGSVVDVMESYDADPAAFVR